MVIAFGWLTGRSYFSSGKVLSNILGSNDNA